MTAQKGKKETDHGRKCIDFEGKHKDRREGSAMRTVRNEIYRNNRILTGISTGIFGFREGDNFCKRSLMEGARHLQSMQAEDPGILRLTSTVCFAMAALALLLAVIFFFLFDIRTIFRIRTGSARKKRIRELHEKNIGDHIENNAAGYNAADNSMETNNIENDIGDRKTALKETLALFGAVLCLRALVLQVLLPVQAVPLPKTQNRPAVFAENIAEPATGTGRRPDPADAAGLAAADGKRDAASGEASDGMTGPAADGKEEEKADKGRTKAEETADEGGSKSGGTAVDSGSKPGGTSGKDGMKAGEAAGEGGTKPCGASEKERMKPDETADEGRTNPVNRVDVDGSESGDPGAGKRQDSAEKRNGDAPLSPDHLDPEKERGTESEEETETENEKEERDGEAADAQETADSGQAGKNGVQKEVQKGNGDGADTKKETPVPAENDCANGVNIHNTKDYKRKLEKDNDKGTDGGKPVLTRVRLQPQGKGAGRTFLIREGKTEEVMEGAARDFTVTIWAEDLPEQGFSGLELAQYRLEPLQGQGDVLTAVVPFSLQEGPENGQDPVRTAVSTPRPLTDGENSLFPKAEAEGACRLCLSVADGDGNWSEEGEITLTFDRTPPGIEAALADPPGVEDWPSCRRADNCAVDVIIREDHLQSWEIRIGSELAVTDTNVPAAWIREGSGGGTAEILVPAREVCKNKDGDVAVTVRAVDEAGQSTGILDRAGGGLAEKRNEEGQIEAAVFSLDTTPPEILVEHRVPGGGTACLYADREDRRDLTLYSPVPVVTTITAADRGGGPGELGEAPDPGRIRAVCFYKSPGSGACTERELDGAGPVPDGEGGRMWRAEFAAEESAEGSYYFLVEATDRAGNISRNGIDATPAAGPGTDSSSDAGQGFGTGQQTIHSCPEILRKTGVLDFRASGTGTGSGEPASDLRSGFTLVYDRTPPELSLTCSSPATAYLYKADPDADPQNSLPQIEACLKQPLTAQAQIVREENPDPARVFFVLSESVPPGVEPRLTRLPIPEGRTGRTFSTTSDGRYVFFLYGQDKAGNGATVAEELASASANREWTGPVVFSPEKNCGTAGRPHFAYSVDTTPPEAEILYTADGENVYLYEEKIAGAGPEAGDGSGQTRTAEPGVSAYGRGSISPSVTIRDRNRLDPDLLQVMEYRGSSPSEMSGKEKKLVPGVVSPAGNETGTSGAASSEGQGSSAAGALEDPGSSGYPESVLTASGIRSLTGPRECAFYAVRGTDRAGNVLKVTERFGGKGKALPGGTGGYRGRPEASGRPGEAMEDGASGADAGWYTARFLLVVDRIPPEIAMTFTPEKNDRKIYLYQETVKEGGPQYAAYFHGTIHPAVTVSEENAIDPDRLVLSVYAGKNRLPEKGTRLSFPCGPAGSGAAGNSGAAVNGRAGQDTVPVDGTRPVSGLKPLQVDGTLAFYEAAGTDRAGNPVRIVQDQVTGSARCSGLDRKGRRIPAAASAAQRKVDQRDPVYRSRLLFVIDRTPPELCLTYVSAARFYLYGDRREGNRTEAAARTVAAAGTGTAAKTVPVGGTGPKAKTVAAASVTPDPAKAGSTAGKTAPAVGHVYAFLSGKVEVKASVTGKNEHIDPGRLFYTCAEGKGKKSGEKKWDREAGMDLLCTDREGEYRFSIWGEDKAGNPAAVTEVIEGKTENRTGSAAAFKKGLKERTEGCETGYASRCSLVIDRTPPKITLEYSLPGATAFVYADEAAGAGKASGKASGAAAGAGADPAGTGRSSGGSGTDDGGARPAGAGSSAAGLQACISGKAEAVFSLEEENPDRSRLFYNRSFRPYLTAPKEADRIRSSWQKTAVFRLPAGSGDGAYSFGAWGRDRAGNPAAVTERFAAGTRVNRQYAPAGCSTARAAGDCGTGYRPLFTIIIDTTPPVYSFSINQPAGLADRFDAARDREIVYYGRAVSGIRAVFRVEDMNFDKNRIRSGICSQLAAGSDGPDHEESGADSDSFSRVSPAWEPPALECTGSSVSGGRTKAIFEMQVEACSRNEGSYRFSIGGSDMAGNLLRPSTAQERNDRSGALKARAAATYPCGTSGSSSGAKNNGQYWSGRKVIDVTPPTGDLRVFAGSGPAGTAGAGGRGGKGGKGGEAFYQFRFDMDANRPVRYEPFRSESRAAALIGTRDLSPTRVSCALRSLDRDRDRIFAASNPVVSGGDRGWSDNNSLEMKVSGDQVFYLEKILLEDRAGNVRINEPGAAWTMAESGRIYLDTDLPRVSPVTDAEAPEVRILADGRFTRHEADGERYIYRPAGKTLDLKVSVTDPGGAARSSGLSKVSLRVTAGDVDITDRVTAEGIPYESNIKKRKKMDKNGNTKIKDTDLLYEIRDAAIHIPTASFAQSNDITVRVEAADNSGNRSSVSRDGGLVRLGIDTVGPLVEVVYRDQAPPVNEKFFAGGRQAEIIVTDRNMDSEKIRVRTNMDAKGGFEAPHPNRTSDGRGEKGDGDRWVKRLAADRDGDYTLDLDGTDALGNRIRQIQWKGPAPRAFTVDRTVPVISIFLQNTDVRNGRYYNRAQTALITVREHNFRRQDLKLELTASAGGDDPRPPEPEPTAFSADGDFHTASVRFDRDGCYSIRVSCTDPAGNRAREAVCGEFVVDMTPPKLLFDRSGPFRFGPAGSGGPGETADTGESAFLAEEAGAAASNGPAVERSAGASAPPAGGWTSNLPLDDCIYTGGLFRPRVRVEDTWFDADRSYFTAEGAGRGTVYRARPEVKVQNRYSSDPPETRGVLRTLFAQNPSLTARGARKAYWNRRAQRCMYTPFEGACTETQNRCIDLCLPEFEIKKGFDDVYYVKACAVDLAGNRSPLARFRFSLNRFGSTFEEGDAGGGRPDPENSRTCAYVRRYYNNRVDGPVSVREISPVRITQYRIYRTKDGFSRELKEGEEYRRITEKETDGDCRYRYEIDDRVFAGDGHYSFLLVTRDREGNENSTAQMMEDVAEPESRDREGNENSTAWVMEDGAEPESMRVTSFPIAFCVDRTPPSIRIAGVDPHERRIRARSLDLTVLPEDGQSGVSSVELRFRTGWRGNGRDIPGRAPCRVLICRYMDPETPASEAAAETAPAAEAGIRSGAETGSSGAPDPETAAQTVLDLHNLTRDGRIEIPVHLEEEARWQLIEIVTRDRAGNESTDTSLRFLVTTDPLVRFLALIEPAAPAAAVLVPALLALFLAAACRKKGSAGSRGL